MRWEPTAVAFLSLALAACGRTDAASSGRNDEATQNAQLAMTTPDRAIDAAVVLEVAPDGNAASYRIREQLVSLDLPNDAVGTTRSIRGSIVLDEQGNVVPGASSIVVDVTELESDQSRRDGFVRGRVLETEQYPTVELAMTSVRGLPFPPPASGTYTFELVGDLTVRGVTRPTTWQVTAEFEGGDVEGTATTRFTFEDFNLTQPRVPVVLSVADTIGLQYDFRMITSAATEPADL